MRSTAWLLILLTACHHGGHEQKDEKRSTERREGPTTTKAPDTPAASAMRAYYTAATCEEREKLIVFPEHNRERLRKMGCSALTDPTIDTAACDASDAGATCYATLRLEHEEKYAWLVKQPTGGWLIDFRASELRQPTFIALQQELPPKPVVLRVWACAAEANERDDSRLVFALRDPSKTSMSPRMLAYMPKDHPDAQTLLALVPGHQCHPVTISLHYATTGLRVAMIDALIEPSFYETEREHGFDGP